MGLHFVAFQVKYAKSAADFKEFPIRSAGVGFSYGIIQIVLWMVFLSAALMWGLLCPNSYRRSKYAGHLRLFHSLSTAVVLVVPIVTALVQLESGFFGFGVPSLLCLAKGSGYVFYALSFVLSLVTLIPAVALVLLGWTILKVRGEGGFCWGGPF